MCRAVNFPSGTHNCFVHESGGGNRESRQLVRGLRLSFRRVRLCGLLPPFSDTVSKRVPCVLIRRDGLELTYLTRTQRIQKETGSKTTHPLNPEASEVSSARSTAPAPGKTYKRHDASTHPQRYYIARNIHPQRHPSKSQGRHERAVQVQVERAAHDTPPFGNATCATHLYRTGLVPPGRP